MVVPLAVNFIAKTYLVRSITEYYWNTQQSEIFLNSYQQKRAYKELHDFEEKIFFDSLILSTVPFTTMSSQTELPLVTHPTLTNSANLSEIQETTISSVIQSNFFPDGDGVTTPLLNESIQKRLQKKTIELAIHYNEESIEAITNFFADMMSFATLCLLLLNLEIQINITKSFLLEIFFGLDDSKKSLFILFLTDLLVGYHSPNIWELFFQSLFDHYGLPESETTIFLLVATLPVLLDVLFKYLIFRHLNRASPATVATYHAMIE